MKKLKSINVIMLGLLLLIVIQGCNRNVIATVSDYENFSARDQSEIASFRKTGCFGFCPIYRVSFYENGQAVYWGDMNVEKVGRHFGYFNKRDFNRIVKKAERTGFFMLSNVYPIEDREFLPDLSNTITKIKSKGKEKTITHNHSGPEELKEIENLFMELIDSIKWVSVE